MSEKFIAGKRCPAVSGCVGMEFCQKAATLAHQMANRMKQGLTPVHDELAKPSCEHATYNEEVAAAREIIRKEATTASTKNIF